MDLPDAEIDGIGVAQGRERRSRKNPPRIALGRCDEMKLSAGYASVRPAGRSGRRRYIGELSIPEPLVVSETRLRSLSTGIGASS